MLRGSEIAMLVLPVAMLVLYDFGYVARMTRASMAEVMTSRYIRTAVLRQKPYIPIGTLKEALCYPVRTAKPSPWPTGSLGY